MHEFFSEQDVTCSSNAEILKEHLSWQERQYCRCKCMKNCAAVFVVEFMESCENCTHGVYLTEWKTSRPPRSAIHIKLNHILWLWPVKESFTSLHRPYRETTKPISLTSKNVKKKKNPPNTLTHTLPNPTPCTYTKSDKNQHVSQSQTNQTQ